MSIVKTHQTSAASDPLLRANHLTLIRFVLAGLVALGHSWQLTIGYEPVRIHQWTGSYMAVNGFFILSGILIAKSLEMQKSLKSYFVSRGLRIYPALILVLLVYIIVFAPIFSNPAGVNRIYSPETLQYALRVLVMGDPEGAPGQIFSGNLEQEFNGPLWTIRFEIAAYIIAALCYKIGALRTFRRALILYLCFQVSYLVVITGIDIPGLPAAIIPLLRLLSCFFLGALIWHWKALRAPGWWFLGLLLVVFLTFGSSASIGEVLGNLLLTGILLKLGLPQQVRPQIANIPDYSYGIYIWHYPVMQVALYIHGLQAWCLLFATAPIFIIISAVSWHLIEKPALSAKQLL